MFSQAKFSVILFAVPLLRRFRPGGIRILRRV